MTSSNNTQLARQAIEAFNAGQLEAIGEGLAPNVVYEEGGTGRRAEGPKAYVQVLADWREAFPDVRGVINSVVTEGDTVVQRITWSGTHQGALQSGAATIPATGRKFSSDAVMWIAFEGGRPVRVFHLLDVLGMLQQLGVLQGAQAQPA